MVSSLQIKLHLVQDIQLFGHHFIIDFILNFYFTTPNCIHFPGWSHGRDITIIFRLLWDDWMIAIWAYCWVIYTRFFGHFHDAFPQKNWFTLHFILFFDFYLDQPSCSNYFSDSLHLPGCIENCLFYVHNKYVLCTDSSHFNIDSS